MLVFQASVSGSGQRFSASQMRLWHTFWVQLVSRDSACWLTGLGFRHA